MTSLAPKRRRTRRELRPSRRAISPDLGPLEQLRAGRLARRLPQLYAGLVLYGLTAACLIRSRLGNAPWDVLHQGIASHLGVSIGVVTIAVSVVVLLGWIPLRQIPGLGTLSNALVVGLATNSGLAVLPAPRTLPEQIALMAAGIAGNAVATAMYIGARFGPGPRDGLMMGLHRRTGRPVWMVRTVLEVSVVAAGIALGGVFGIGTVLYAVTIGPLVQPLLPLFEVRTGEVRTGEVRTGEDRTDELQPAGRRPDVSWRSRRPTALARGRSPRAPLPSLPAQAPRR